MQHPSPAVAAASAGAAPGAGLPGKAVDPRMHSAEHVLTAALMKLLGSDRPCTTHIERKKSKADYLFPRPLTPQEVLALETEVNRVLLLDLPVTEEFLPRQTAAGAYNLTRLPTEAGDPIRIVHMGDYDACPCIGPHVPHTAVVGTFKIISTSWEAGFLRIRFKLQP